MNLNCKDYFKVENLYKFLLAEKNSFIFESAKKEFQEVDIQLYTNHKIWDINKNTVTIISEGKKLKLKLTFKIFKQTD